MSTNEAMEYRPTFAQRCRRWLFPYRHAQEPPFSFRGDVGITTHVKFHFSPLDRLRIVVGGKLEAETITNCEIDPGKTASRTYTQIL